MSKESRGRNSSQFMRVDPSISSSSMQNSAGEGTQSSPPPKDSVLQKLANSPNINRPYHVANPATDVRKQLRVFSGKRDEWVDVNAIFVADLEKFDQSWISEELVQRLQLHRGFKPEGQKQFGRLGSKTFRFSGSLMVRWVERGSHKSNYTPCRIVPRDSFQILLKNSLLSSTTTQEEPAQDEELSSLLLPASLDDPDVSSALSTGSFDGLSQTPGTIDDSSAESISADTWISNFERSVLKCVRKLPPRDSSLPRLKIALLDTGIDVSHPSIIGAMISGRINKKIQCFVEDTTSIADECGHGTHIAALLSHFAPQAEIYIAKIARDYVIPSNHNITKAIKWATALEVDIITMSFGLEKHDHDMQGAILAAYLQNIIMLSAASNQGGNFEVKYPARTREVLCIYSTDGMGEPSRFNPTKMMNESHHFAILGEGIKSAWPKASGANSALYQRMSGTSFAVPMAAVTAVNILEFALRKGMKEKLYKKLRSFQGMHLLFSELVSEKRKEFHYIHPWMLFAIGDNARADQYIFDRIEDLMNSRI